MREALKILMIIGGVFQGTGTFADIADFPVRIISTGNNYINYEIMTNGTCYENTPMDCHWFNFPDNTPMNLQIQQTSTGNTCNFTAKNTSNGAAQLNETGGKNCTSFFRNITHLSGQPSITEIHID